MYSIVMMMALTSSAEQPAFGRGCSGCGGCWSSCHGCSSCYGGGCSSCHGGSSCYGGCWSSCHGCSSCYGGGCWSSCHGSSSCHGCCGGGGIFGGGLFSKHNSCCGGGCWSSCHGSCHGTVSYSCCGGYSGCCGGISYSGCCGGVSYSGCCGGGYAGCVGAGCVGYSGGCVGAGCIGYGAGIPAAPSVPYTPSITPGTFPGAVPGTVPGTIPSIPAPPVTPGKVIDGTKTDAGSATIIVNLPADATLTVDGRATTSTTNVRRLATPTLEAGKEFSYTLTAEVVRDGQKLVAVEKVNVMAGRETNITLTPKAETVAK